MRFQEIKMQKTCKFFCEKTKHFCPMVSECSFQSSKITQQNVPSRYRYTTFAAWTPSLWVWQTGSSVNNNCLILDKPGRWEKTVTSTTTITEFKSWAERKLTREKKREMKQIAKDLAPFVVRIVCVEPEVELNLLVLGPEHHLLHQGRLVAHGGWPHRVLHTTQLTC